MQALDGRDGPLDARGGLALVVQVSLIRFHKTAFHLVGTVDIVLVC